MGPLEESSDQQFHERIRDEKKKKKISLNFFSSTECIQTVVQAEELFTTNLFSVAISAALAAIRRGIWKLLQTLSQKR
jgi:hypothetical protein